MSKKHRSLEIDEDPQFQKKEWFFQRIGIALLFLLVLAALLGYTGAGGPMSRGEARDQSGTLRIEYERYVRRGGLSTVKLHLRGGPGNVRFWVSAPYFEHVRIDSVAPTPELVSVESDRHVYEFRSGSSNFTVTLMIEHESMGSLDAEIGLVGGPSVRFRQLALF